MTARILRADEWPEKLQGTELETAWPHLDPQAAQVLAVETADGQLVACWALLVQFHVEGLWIHPDHRGKTAPARRLWAFLRVLARQIGFRTVATAATSDDIRALLAHVGAVRLDADHYVMKVR